MPWFHFDANDFSVAFLSILFEGIPFMFIGTLIAGLVDAFMPEGGMERVTPRGRLLSAGLGGLLGIVFPMCECGVVPVIRRLLLKGMPVSGALAYLLAAPIVNPVVAASTFTAFRGQNPLLVMALRLGLGYGVACLLGWLAGRLPLGRVLNDDLRAALDRNQARRIASPGEGAANPAQRSFRAKLLSAFRCTGHDFVEVAFYLVIGAALAALFNTAVRRDVILPFAQHPPLATAAMMVFAFLLSLCSTSDAFIAANFTVFPLGAKLAFMLFGPMMDLKLVFMYGLVFRRAFTARVAVVLFLVIWLIGLVMAEWKG